MRGHERFQTGLTEVTVIHPRTVTRRLNAILLVSHGNGSDVDSECMFHQSLADAVGTTVVSWEYPGYGSVPGTPSSAAICTAAEDAYDWALRYFPPRTNIVLVGHSIGTGPACHLSRTRLGHVALILISPFTTIAAIIGEHFHWLIGACSPAIYDNMTAIRQLRAPLLLIHGKRDTLIPHSHSERLYAAAVHSMHRKAHYVPYADHNTWRQEEDIFRPIDAFLDKIRLGQIVLPNPPGQSC